MAADEVRIRRMAALEVAVFAAAALGFIMLGAGLHALWVTP
jgi:hypothetical protein